MPRPFRCRPATVYLFLLTYPIASLYVLLLLAMLCCAVLCRLGQYSPNQFDDDRVRVPLAKFQQAIEDIETDLMDT